MMLFNRWIDEQTVVYPDNGILFCDEKGFSCQVPPPHTQKMNPKCTMLVEINQSAKTENV